MISPLGVLGAIIVFGAIIFFHELGHFIIAKLSRMAVYEFSMGFGPALFSREYKDTLYAIRIIPLGGYVRIAGMEPDEDPDVENGFNSKPFVAKFGTILAGVMMNFILALLLFVIIGAGIGYRQPGAKTLIGGLMPNAPAAQAGLKPGDAIVAVDGIRNPSVEKASELIRNGQVPAQLVIERDGKEIPFTVKQYKIDYPERDGAIFYRIVKKNGIGIVLSTDSGPVKRLGIGESVVHGFTSVIAMIVDAFRQVMSMITGRIPFRMISGPPGIIIAAYSVSKDAFSSLQMFAGLLGFIAFISVFVGFFNLLPIPALDGSRLFFLVVDAVCSLFGRRIDPKKEAMVHMVGLVVLLGFIVIVSVFDVIKAVTHKM